MEVFTEIGKKGPTAPLDPDYALAARRPELWA